MTQKNLLSRKNSSSKSLRNMNFWNWWINTFFPAQPSAWSSLHLLSISVKTAPDRQENLASQYLSTLYNVSCMIFLLNFLDMLYWETQVTKNRLVIKHSLWVYRAYYGFKSSFKYIRFVSPFLITQLMTCVIWDNQRLGVWLLPPIFCTFCWSS